MTYRQAQALGGQVRKGEQGETVVYADRIVRQDSDTVSGDAAGDTIERVISFLKAYTVFNIEQIDKRRQKVQPFRHGARHRN